MYRKNKGQSPIILAGAHECGHTSMGLQAKIYFEFFSVFSMHMMILPHCVTKFQCLSESIRANGSFDLFSMRLKNCVKGCLQCGLF